jgi:ATP-binding cassette subfamily B protein
MEDGSIVEQGNHNELLAVDGAYARLYNAQFSAAVVDIDEEAATIAAPVPTPGPRR